MENLKKAVDMLENLNIKADGVLGLSTLLWQSTAEGMSELEEDIYSGATYLLRTEIEDIHDKLHEVIDMIYDKLKEARA